MTDCIAQAIWGRCLPDVGDLRRLTAQQRHAWDEALRAELAEVKPEGLRQHAADMIREWRDHAFGRNAVNSAALDELMASDAHIIADPDYGLPPRARILRDAERLICGPREADYGPPAKSFARAAALASLATGHRLTPRDVVEVLHAVKTARLRQQRDHADGLVDRIGYAALAAEVSDDFADTLAALGAEVQP